MLIECGIRYKDIQKALNFDTTHIEGCLVTHEHQDHAKAMQDVLNNSIEVYTSKGTAEAIGINHYRLNEIQARKTVRIGTWKVMPFEVEHDAKEPFGYLIENQEGERLLFATDTYYIKYRFNNINIIAVECNYDEDILDQNIKEGLVPIVMKKRLYKSHFNLENYKEFLRANDLSNLREVHVLHMSRSNGNEKLFKEEIQKITGTPVYIAR